MEVFGESLDTFDIVLGSIAIAIAVVALIGNLFVIILYWWDRKLRNKKRNLFLISLAYANIFTSIVAIPLSFLVSLFLQFRNFN